MTAEHKNDENKSAKVVAVETWWLLPQTRRVPRPLRAVCHDFVWIAQVASSAVCTRFASSANKNNQSELWFIDSVGNRYCAQVQRSIYHEIVPFVDDDLLAFAVLCRRIGCGDCILWTGSSSVRLSSTRSNDGAWRHGTADATTNNVHDR